MAELIPARWRSEATKGPANALVCTIQTTTLPSDPQLIVVSARRRRRETERLAFSVAAPDAARLRSLLRQRGQGLPVVIRPPGGWLLERDVTLPIAAAEELGRVLSYEMDRFTPFRADEVIWRFVPLSRDGRSGVVRVRLSLVPRRGLNDLIAALAAAGVTPDLLECQRSDGDVRVIAIERPPTPRDRRRRRARLVLAFGCAALAVAVIAQPLVRQSIAISNLDARIAALQPQVRRAEALRARISGAVTGSEIIAKEQSRTGNVLQIMAALTQILPDDTYLTSLTLSGRSLTIEGQSAAAAKLITALSNDRLFAEPSFTAPVTRTDRGADLFALRTRINPTDASGPDPAQPAQR